MADTKSHTQRVQSIPAESSRTASITDTTGASGVAQAIREMCWSLQADVSDSSCELQRKIWAALELIRISADVLDTYLEAYPAGTGGASHE